MVSHAPWGGFLILEKRVPVHEARQHVRHVLQGGGSSAAGLSHGAPSSAETAPDFVPNISPSQIIRPFQKERAQRAELLAGRLPCEARRWPRASYPRPSRRTRRAGRDFSAPGSSERGGVSAFAHARGSNPEPANGARAFLACSRTPGPDRTFRPRARPSCPRRRSRRCTSSARSGRRPCATRGPSWSWATSTPNRPSSRAGTCSSGDR